MTEHFFIVPKGCAEYEEYINYQNKRKLVCEKTKEFMNDHGIESDSFIPHDTSLEIEATPNDIEKFSPQFTKYHDKFYTFRKNSKIGKAWKTLGVKVPHKPYVPFWFAGRGNHNRTRLFAIGDVLYCSIDTNSENLEAPEHFQRLKASEFWKIVEDWEDCQE